MKRIVAVFLIGLTGALAQAEGVVTDLFECHTKLVDLKTNESAQSSAVVAGIRMPSPLENPNYDLTTAETNLNLTLNSRRAVYNVGFKISYNFATKELNNFTVAKQHVCNALSISICPRGNNNNGCTAAAEACIVHPDPFDSKYGWGGTGMKDGIPVFNQKLIRPINTILAIGPQNPNGARLTATCKHKGTFY